MTRQARILVVDDEPRWLEPLSHVLVSAGYDVRATNGGEAALASVADGLPDLVLLDIRMPGMGGFEVLERFKKREETREIPILLISAFAEVDERIEGLRLGAADSVTKPFHAGELLARVRMHLELSRLRAEHAAQTAALKTANDHLEREIAEHRRASQLLSLVLNSIPDCVFWKDRNSVYLGCNNAFAAAAGVGSPDQIAGKTDYQLAWKNEESDFFVTVDRRVMENDRAESHIIEPQQHADGRQTWLETCKVPLHDENGKVIGILGTYMDITERQQTENKLRKSEAQLNFALEMLAAGAWELDLVDHTAQRTPLHDRIFGYETLLPEWTYEMFLEHVLPEDRADVDRCFREATEAQCDWGFECRIRRKDGEVRWIWATGAHERNPEGQPVRIAGIVQDITERRAVEQALRENEENLTITLQSIGDAVIATDAMGRITRMNPVAERLTGWPLAEAEGRPLAEVFRIINAQTRQPAEDPVEQVITRGITVGLANHTVLLARGGREYQIADSAAPIRDAGGEILGVVLVFSDITASYESREALRRSEEDYRMLFEEMLDGFALHEIICDGSGRPADYRFLSINPAFEKMTGIRAADAVGKTVRELLPEIEEVWIERYGRVALTGEPVQFEERNTALGKDFHVTAFQPQPGQFAVVFEDVTQRNETARKLALRESFLSAITENLPGLLWLKDVTGRFLMVNKAFAEACGREGREEVFGLTDHDIWPKDLADTYREHDKQLLGGGAPLMVEEEIFTGGERVWFETFKTPVRDAEGRVIGTTGYSLDVTERKAAQARIVRLTHLYAALSQCNQAIVHSGSLEELLPQICGRVVEFGGMKMAWIGLLDEAARTVRPAAIFGEGTDYLEGIQISTDGHAPTGRGPTGTAIRENRPVWCQDYANDPSTAPWHEHGARYGWRAAAALPLRRGGNAVGALVVYSDKAHVFDQEVRELLEELAEDISYAFDNFARADARRRAEEALVESEATMRFIVKHDPNALAVFDNGLHYLAVSDRFLQDYNVREEDILGRHHYEVFPEIPQVWRDVHQRCLAGAIERNDDDSFRRPDGSITYNRWECRPWYRNGGEIGGIIIYSEVTTERKLAEEKVKASERDLARAQAIAHLGSWSWDVVSDRVSWSEEMFRIYGVDPAGFDATVEGVARLIHPEDLWKQERAINESLAGQPSHPYDYRVILPDGTERAVEVSSVQIEADPEGRPLRMFGVAQDITDRKQAEDALRESEERFRLMLQHIPSISVQGYLMDGTTSYWNDASEALYGYSAEEAIGKNLLDLIIPPEMREEVSQAIKTMGETLVPIPASELTLMRKDGSRVSVYSSHAAVVRRGREPEMFCIDIDLTDRKRAEDALKGLNAYLEESRARAEELAVKAEAAARAKSEFLALMSHELRTPLNGVLGFAELLAGTRLDEEQREYTQTIFDSGTHLLDVVNDILDLASLEKGCLLIESAPIHVPSLVESSCRLIRKTAADKGLGFSFESAPDVPEEITGDARRIRQILINLLGNAVKFTQAGSVVLRVSPASDEGRPALDFTVEDTGPGIPDDILGELFEPFTQADSSVSRPFEGTGLGLAISLRLAEAMGGTLGVASTPGQGSRFTFRFPLRDDAPAPSKNRSGTPSPGPDEKRVAAPFSRSGKPVLVVEDDPSSRILAGKILEHLGCRAEFAVNGLEAIEAFAPGKFSAILMDMQMAVMDGLEATRGIRERESGTRVPVIAMTANVMPGDRERCLAAGMDDVLTKPFKITELSGMLARFLQD